MMLKLLLVAAVVVSYTEAAMMVCYYGSWAVYRPGQGKFDVEDLDPNICTHIIFGFAGLDRTTYELKVLDPYNELCENWGKCGYDRFVALKQSNPSLKAILAIGGWNEGSATYSTMSTDPSKRKTFIDSVVARLKKHGFDGLDMDWEYPTQRGGAPEDKVNYITLLQELKAAFEPEGLLLTAAVSAGKPTIDAAYNIPEMNKYIDVLNLMAYDFHGAWDPFTHHQTPLYQYPSDAGQEYEDFNVDFAVNYWISNGFSKDKIALGMGLYGRCWSLNNGDEHGMLAPATNPGPSGPYTRSPGMLGYNEICEKQQSQNWEIVHDPDLSEPYAYYLPWQKIWCGYDDHDSLITKAVYARDKGLGGCMVWSVETDDFHGTCGSRTFDLIKTIYESFTDSVITAPPPPTTTTRDPSLPTDPVTTTSSTTSTDPALPPPTEHCKVPGNNPHPTDCSIFYQCVNGGDSWIEYEAHCGDGSLFNPISQVCDRWESVCAVGDICPDNCS